ncbi:DUF5131 family protein [Ferrovibrio sp.]|uniref:DUF5131 family protein n=1 Tax=Ferrovibrio sp. TaxID=1917215 RepID=UPI0035B26D05
MAKHSKIEWTHHSWNPWWGCTKVGPGCDNCYAEAFTRRLRMDVFGLGKPRRTFGDKHWHQPPRWNAEAEREGHHALVFGDSMCDVFDKEAPAGLRGDLWQLVKATPHLIWIFATKRIGNAAKYLPADWGTGYANVVLLISSTGHEEYCRDMPVLRNTPARWRGVSAEPLLGPIYPFSQDLAWIDWFILGGESGSDGSIRPVSPMHPHWARIIVSACLQARTPVLFKQWGRYLPGSQLRDLFTDAQLCDIKVKTVSHNNIEAACFDVGKHRAGRVLDGIVWDQFPKFQVEA